MFISIEGCIGVGKTTLARLCAEHYSAHLLCEETKKHPFIAEFYVDPSGYAFQTEMNFILIHYHQLQKARKEGLFKHIVFSDFIFDKDRIFADLTLEDREEEKLFTLTYDFLKNRIETPDLLICLKASTEFLFERIKKRGRDFEAKMPFDYLDRLNTKYNEFFESYNQSEKIVINAQDLHVDDSGSAIRGMLKKRVAPLLDHIVNISHGPEEI